MKPRENFNLKEGYVCPEEIINTIDVHKAWPGQAIWIGRAVDLSLAKVQYYGCWLMLCC